MVPDFLHLSSKVLPNLYQMLFNYKDQAITNSDSAQTAEKGLCALSQFAGQMDDSEIRPYLKTGLELIDAYLNGAGQKPKVRFQALMALSAYILTSEHLIHPFMTGLLANLN